jgi:hypothetical protein
MVRRALALVLSTLAASCGGGEPTPVAPTEPTAAAATASATAAPTAEAASAPVYDVDLLEDRNAPQPDKLPSVRVDTPGYDSSITPGAVESYKVRYKIGNWASMPKGAYVQFILDDVPAAPVTDPATEVKLTDLAGGKPLGEGEHLLVAYVARDNHESIKGEGTIAIRRFWIGKKLPSDWSYSDDPLLVLGRPHGTYQGSDSRYIKIDLFVLNAELGKGHRAILKVTGPGIPEGGLSHRLEQWVPMLLTKAHEGEYRLKIELRDAKETLVPAPYNPTERTFTVKP